MHREKEVSREGEEIPEDYRWDVLTGIQGSYTLAGTREDERREINEIAVKHFLETLAEIALAITSRNNGGSIR